MKVRDIAIGTAFQMTTQYGVNNVVKIASPEDINPNSPLREIGYFTWLDRPDAVSREAFIKGMREEVGGRTNGGFAIWQHELDHGWINLEPVIKVNCL